MKILNTTLLKYFVIGLSFLTPLSCSRPDSDRASIKLITPPSKPTDTIEKATADVDTALRLSERALNALRFARFQISHFYRFDGADFPAKNCFLPDPNMPRGRWNWNACPVGESGVANGTTDARSGAAGNFDDITTELDITPIKTIVAPSFTFRIDLTKLVKTEDSDGNFQVSGDAAVYFFNSKSSKSDLLYELNINFFRFLGKISDKRISQTTFKSGESILYKEKNVASQTANFLAPSVMGFLGTQNFVKGSFDLEIKAGTESFGRQKISFDEKNITALDGKTREWACKDLYGCLPLPIPKVVEASAKDSELMILEKFN